MLGSSTRLPALYHALERRYPDGIANRRDGLRVDLPDRWFHVRASQTELEYARTAYQKARIELDRTIGRTLSTYGISIDGGRTGSPAGTAFPSNAPPIP